MSLDVPFAELVGKTIGRISGSVGDAEFLIETEDGQIYALYHEQDCCESVVLQDITGDLHDLLGTPILVAEEVSSRDDPADYTPEPYRESFTWTFYKLRTIKGGVTLRWLGESNGYYSESVSFARRR